MIITPHALAGAAVATTTNNVPLAFFLGFISHFILDAIPHVDQGTFFKSENEPWPAWIYYSAIGEAILAVAVFYFLFHHRSDFSVISVGAIGGVFVDFLDNTPARCLRKLPGFKQLHWLHEKVHFDLRAENWYWGLPSQIIIIGGTLWYLLK